MDTKFVELLGSTLIAFGSILLAFRVAGMLKALAIVADAHEFCIKGFQSVYEDPSRSLIQMRNSNKHVKNAKKLPLLICGFVLVISGVCLQAASLLMQILAPGS